MKTNYDLIKNIFIQRALSCVFIESKLKTETQFSNFLNWGELDYLCWRYVFMKDITKTHLTKKLSGFGFDNLTVVELIDGLNATRQIVKDLLKRAKEEQK